MSPCVTSRESYLRFCKAAGTLIVPPWKSAQYWLSLCKTEFCHWNDFIHDWMILPPCIQPAQTGKAKNAIFGNSKLKFTVVALRIDFAVPPRHCNTGFRTVPSKRCQTCFQYLKSYLQRAFSEDQMLQRRYALLFYFGSEHFCSFLFVSTEFRLCIQQSERL